jgi:hypothetical protein
MSRIALFGCTSVFLMSWAWQVSAAPPSEQKGRVIQPTAKVVVAPSTKNAPKIGAATRSVVNRTALPRTSTSSTALAASKPPATKPVVAGVVRINPNAGIIPQQKPQTAVKSPLTPTPALAGAKRAFKQAGLIGRNAPKFDSLTRSNLGVSPRQALTQRAGTTKKIAGAAIGAALIGGGLAALGKLNGATASTTNRSTAVAALGPVRPAARLPLANLNHPHVKPVARLLPPIIGHKHANRPRLPLYVLAPTLLGAVWMGREFFVWNRRSYDNVGWIAPIPSCYVGGTVFYRNPWTGNCFNFESAEPGDHFAVGTKIYAWAPAKYPGVEDMVDEQERSGASVTSDQFRLANPMPPASRVAVAAGQLPAALGVATAVTTPNSGQNLEVTDCSSCLTAIGPVEVTGGQCSVTISNNCGLPVAFDVEFQRDDQTFCQSKMDAASASEVIVCTQPCTTFLEARVKLKSAMPKFANTAPFKGCRAHWAALEDQPR